MALQDLTPQLRTRLNRVERAVGWFVLLATLLLLGGFGYYLHSVARQKGWFKAKAPFFTYADTGAGLSLGDPVQLLGFPAGQIMRIVPMPARGPGSEHNVYIEFEIVEPNFGYLWTEGSEARLTASGFLGKRQLEVTRGTNGYAAYIQFPIEQVSLDQITSHANLDKMRLGEEIRDGTNILFRAWSSLTNATKLAELVQKAGQLGRTNLVLIDTTAKKNSITAVWNVYQLHYQEFSREHGHIFELPPYEEPALNDRLQAMVSKIEAALPNVLDLTNKLTAVLSNSAALTEHLDAVATDARPMVSNLTFVTAQLKTKGSLGEWLVSSNFGVQVDTTLQNANVTLTNANTNVARLADEVSLSLENLANITSNLNNQVQVNSNILSELSDIVVHSDQFIQGLKRHWLLRSAFKTPKTNAPPARTVAPARSPKAQGER